MKKSRNKKGMTLTEVLMATFLLSVIFLAVASLHTASQRMFIQRDNKVVISYELQYAVQHIYKNVMMAIGDVENSPIEIVVGDEDIQTLNIRINNNEFLTRDNYEDVDNYTYTKIGNELMFDDGENEESLAPRINVTDVNFSLDENLLTVSLTGSYGGEDLTVHTACYPRMASLR